MRGTREQWSTCLLRSVKSLLAAACAILFLGLVFFWSGVFDDVVSLKLETAWASCAVVAVLVVCFEAVRCCCYTGYLADTPQPSNAQAPTHQNAQP